MLEASKPRTKITPELSNLITDREIAVVMGRK
jgi:hypothetical protein